MRRNSWIGGRSAGLLAGAVLLLVSCSSTPDRAKVVENLERTGVSRPVAECVADAFFEHLTYEEIARISERGATGVVDDQSKDDESIDIARRTMSECRQLDDTTTTTAPDEGSGEDEGSTNLPG